MTTITFITGLCGSGKTYYSEQLKKKTGALLFEGIGKGIENNENWLIIVSHLKNGNDCVVEEMDFCFQKPRDSVIKYILGNTPDTEIKWVCFENDLDSANWNVRQRTNKADINGHLYINAQLTRFYTYQFGAKIVPITRIQV